MKSHLAGDDGPHGMAYDDDLLGVKLEHRCESERSTADDFGIDVSARVLGQRTACAQVSFGDSTGWRGGGGVGL